MVIASAFTIHRSNSPLDRYRRKLPQVLAMVMVDHLMVIQIRNSIHKRSPIITIPIAGRHPRSIVLRVLDPHPHLVIGLPRPLMDTMHHLQGCILLHQPCLLVHKLHLIIISNTLRLLRQQDSNRDHDTGNNITGAHRIATFIHNSTNILLHHRIILVMLDGIITVDTLEIDGAINIQAIIMNEDKDSLFFI